MNNGMNENYGQFLDDTLISSFDDVSKQDNYITKNQEMDISDIVLKSDVDH